MAQAPAVALELIEPPVVQVPGNDNPVKRIGPSDLKQLGQNLSKMFDQYASDRQVQELRWLRNLRQYLGYYDPEVESLLSPNRSKAYPKITRVKCISMLSRIMDLMFPSDDTNWTITARPSPQMDIEDVKAAVQEMVSLDTDQDGNGPQIDDAYVQRAVQALAEKRAKALEVEIHDQLEELGGDQSYDYVALNKEVVASAILMGIGSLTGPFAREVKTTAWKWDPVAHQPVADTTKKYMPQFEFLRCWDFYPDMSAKRIEDGDGYFIRKVMSKRQLKDLGKRDDFFNDVIDYYLNTHDIGNYRPKTFESQLREMGTRENVNDQKASTSKYEVIIWRGPIDGHYLVLAGADVPENKRGDMIDAEVWIIDGYVIKCDINPWIALGQDVRTCHSFVFDQDDTSPIGFGLPNVMRDTQMAISASTRMMLDNASVVCGPLLEVNTALLRADQDASEISAYKIWYRNDETQTAQWPAVRPIEVSSHIDELQKIIDLFLKIGDMETFVSPMNGGDMSQMPSEPMRNAAGASMLMGHAALPFKDIIRNYDRFTMSVIQSLVAFNRALNPTVAETAEFDVIARGATSLIAKELRGAQVDSFAQTLSDDEKMHVDPRKLVIARAAARDLDDVVISEDEARRKQAAAAAAQQAQQAQAEKLAEANVRKLLSDAFKNIAQGDKNTANANAAAVDTAIAVLEHDNDAGLTQAKTIGEHAKTAQTLQQTLGGADAAGGQGPAGAAAAVGADANDAGGPGGAAAPGAPGMGGPGIGAPNPAVGLMLPGGADPTAGAGPGLAGPPG